MLLGGFLTMSAEPLLPPDAKLEKLAGGMKFLEGPVYMPDGALLFSDQGTDKTMRWTRANGLSFYKEKGDGCNGNTLDLQGRRVTCEGSLRRVVVNEIDGTVRVLVDRFEEKRFNSPNDVVVKSDGTVWFTDPPYGLPKGQQRELENNCVFCLDPVSGAIKIVADDIEMPNGLCFSPDEKRLYIADSGRPHHVRVFDVRDDNPLAGGAVFCIIDKGVPDGMRCDEHGNLWSTAGDGIHIFSSRGKLIQKIPVPESPANCCFGGEDGKTLFITARTSLYSIKTN